MSLIDEYKNKSGYKVAPYINGQYPWYSQYGNNILASDVVQQCIRCTVNELCKLDITHVKISNIDGQDVPVNGPIQKILDNPNPLMTAFDYKSKMFTNLMLNKNAFAYVMWDGGKPIALYPLQPTSIKWLIDPSNAYFVEFTFASGYTITLPYSCVIHMRIDYYSSEFMGGNIQGQADNQALLETLELNEVLLKGLAKSLKMQMSVNGVIKLKTMVNLDAQKQEINHFEKKLENNESGLLPIDNQAEYIPISKQIALLDKTTLEFIQSKILNYFGVSMAIFSSDFTPEQYEAFYQKTLEPIVRMTSEAHTKGIFTNKESFGYGNKIKFYSKELVFMNMNQKISFINILVDTSSAYKNEIRCMAGMRPLKELEGQIAESSNKTNAENNKEQPQEKQPQEDNTQDDVKEEGDSNE